MTGADAFLRSYDEQLRGGAETAGALGTAASGPLRLATFPGGRDFVTYPHLEGADAERLAQMVPEVLDHFRADPDVVEVEWKTRGHDHAPGLYEGLLAYGFEPEEPESIMIGHAHRMAVDVPLPQEVALRRVREDDDIRAMVAMQDAVFNKPAGEGMVQALISRLSLDDGMELWVAEAEGQVIAAGRLGPVAGTDFAGIWGGAVLEQWRGRGIYRALTAARARSAVAAGKTLINSDSTEYSRPILERSGFLKISTTTPYVWQRPAP